ncbi:hypothetical protein [Halobellus inordinatus]|uniref:hypothetical protein n=1 Tax=Halobellus inordinatus TaxID=1126236 RepID=UPI00210AD6DC|nr:hypothetical protein [Halobellus inordinatus]
MSLGGDDRAVTVQIGAVLLLGFLVISLSLYQATVVPQENRQIEFQHNQRVQSDLQEVRNTILGTAATGSSAPASVELGTQYPTRVVAVNPAPPSGTLSTSSLGNITIRNATADDLTTDRTDNPETADFWDGTPHNYTTKSLVYQPSYANYDGAPTTAYENGLVYNRFGAGGTTLLTDQSIVSGKRISLVALDGSLSRGGASTLTVDPRAVSVSTRTISISNETADISIVVPTELGVDEWEDAVEQSSEYVEVDSHPRGVELVFDQGVTYQLKLSKVGVGTNVEETDTAYLTSVEDLPESPFAGQTYSFEVESRDKYNNPVRDNVVAGPDIPNGVVLETGRYRYQYTAGTAGPDWVNVTSRFAENSPYDVDDSQFEARRNENVQYDMEVQTGGGGGPGVGTDGPLTLRAGSGEVYEQTGIQFVVDNGGSQEAVITEIELSTDSAAKVYEGSSSQNGAEDRETFIDVGDDGANTENPEDGYYESGDSNENKDSWQIGSLGTLSETARIPGDGVARFYIYEFISAGPGGSGSPVDMAGSTVTVTVTYTVSGTEYTESFDVTA